MAQFRKKPVVIEAKQWIGHARKMPIPPAPYHLLRQHGWPTRRWELRTLEGWCTLTPNDWVIRGIAGEYYPCKPDIFAATHEGVS